MPAFLKVKEKKGKKKEKREKKTNKDSPCFPMKREIKSRIIISH